MEISIRIREKLRKGLITVCLFYCGFHSALLGQSLSRSKQNNNMVTSRHYSSAFALDTARQALIPIRRLYPQACIREYQEGKLGPIIDMNIDHRINDKTYDAR